MSEPPVVLYGYSPDEGTYLFIPEAQVDRLISIHGALWTSRTWGEFWSRLPTDERERLQDRLEWHANDAELYGDPESAAEYRPIDTQEFDVNRVPGVEDGDYPRIIRRDLIEWIPADIIGTFGHWDSSPVSGDFLTIDPPNDRFAELEAAFAAHGFTLVRDDIRVLRANGRLE